MRGARLVAAVMLLLACTGPSPRADPPLLARTAARFSAAGDFDNPAWLPGGRSLVASLRIPTVEPTGPSREWFLVEVPLDGGPVTRLPIPNDPDCRRTASFLPRLLADGRVAFLQRCEGLLNPRRRLAEDVVSLLVYDPRRQTTERLVPYYLAFGDNFFDFAPSMEVGIINDGNGLYERLHWLRPHGQEPLDLPLERAAAPRWSPDGRAIAFGGAPPVPGWRVEGHGRLDLERKLYVLSVESGALQALVDDAEWVSAPAWSPDGRWLVVGLHLRSGEQGLWLIEVATRRRFLLLEGGDVGGANWAPDGRSIAVVMGKKPSEEAASAQPFGIYIFDLPDLDELAAR